MSEALETPVNLETRGQAPKLRLGETVRRHIVAADDTESLNGFTLRIDNEALERAAVLESSPQVCAQGLLRGWVGVVKDNIHIAGLQNSAGSPALQGFVPHANAPVISTIVEHGAIILGKTNMHELAFGATSNNPTYGAVRNPFDDSRSAGGSSGGTAVVVASGAARFGLGTDTGGSVRIPAALTGLYGLRPTTGRYSAEGVTPISPSRDTVGVMARTLDDLDTVDRAISGSDEGSSSTSLQEARFGIPASKYLDVLDADVRAAWGRTLDLICSAGASIVSIDMSEIDRLEQRWGMPLVFAEMYPALEGYLAEYAPTVSLGNLIDAVASPDVTQILTAHYPGSESDRSRVEAEARAGRAAAAATYERLLTESDVAAVLMPTTPVPAPLVGDEDEMLTVDGKLLPTFDTLLGSASVGSFIGVPGLTIPMGRSHTGLPIGLSVDGPAWSDRRLISIAKSIDDVLNEDR